MESFKPLIARPVFLAMAILTVLFPAQSLFANSLSWTCPYCGETFISDPRYPAYFEQWKQFHMSQCPKRPGAGYSGNSGAGSAGGDALYQSSYELGKAIGKLLFGDPDADARRRAMEAAADERAREMERERLKSEQEKLLRKIKEKEEQYARLASELKLDPLPELAPLGFDGRIADLVPMGMEDVPKLRPMVGDSAQVDVARGQHEFDKMNDAWMRNQKALIDERLKGPNKWCSSIYASLKTKEPPLPGKGFDDLQPGDVLLISPDDAKSDMIQIADRLSSWEWKSPASHTVLFLKEVNGKKLLLDNVSGGQSDAAAGVGPHIITGEQFLKVYGQRMAHAAQLAQPLNKEEAAKLWGAARDLGIKELADERKKAKNLIDKTDYGLYGDDKMVCSESSRWALIKAGRSIPETASPFKKLMGIYYGPANFYSDEQTFLITPLR